MTETTRKKLIEQLVAGAAIASVTVFAMRHLGWNPPPLLSPNVNHFDYDVEWNRMSPALMLWMIFGVYWSIAARNSAPAESSESRVSTYFHQLVLAAALFLLFAPAPGLTGWFLPQRFHFLVAVGVIVQAGFLLLAVWARRHLGRNWSAEVRIGEGHELVRSGPYRLIRHPICTAMLGMFLGTGIASSQYHALLGLAILVVAYLRKTRLEEQILLKAFGADFEVYQRSSWALVPLVF
ncbi:MAG: isoprenylcysteine carboxylmethyltransferase family protein [Terriglobales bacterium]|jgi:protein-S-isoprenylcysteine O-methyltransferase Ste14